MIKAEWTNKDSLDLQPTCNKLATDTISRQAAIDELIAMREHIDARMSVIGCTAYEIAIEALREPERKKGKWLLHTYMPHNKYCSCCEKDSPYGKRWNFCPNCGADMRGEDDETD